MDFARDAWAYELSVGAMQRLLTEPPSKTPELDAAGAARLGIVGLRPSVRRIDGEVTPVLILSVRVDAHPELEAGGRMSGVSPRLRAAGIPEQIGGAWILVEPLHGVGRILPLRPAVGAGLHSSAPSLTHPGSPLCTVLASPRSATPEMTPGGTLGGVVLLNGDPKHKAVVSCSHCIAISDSVPMQFPDVGDAVIPVEPGPASPSTLASNVSSRAIGSLERWTSLEDRIDVAAAEILPDRGVHPRPDDPYLWPLSEDGAKFGECVWFVGAGSRRRRVGVVESTRARCYIQNADGSNALYDGLLAVGRQTDRGWRPVTVSGDSGAWLLAWRDEHVDTVGMLAFAGTPLDRPASSSLSLAFSMSDVLRALAGGRMMRGRRRRRVMLAYRVVSVDGEHAIRGLPRPDWLSDCQEVKDAQQHQTEPAMSGKDNCIVYNFHFHATAHCGSPPAAPSDASPDPASRTGFSNFMRFRVTVGDVNTGSARRVTGVRLKAERQGLPTLNWTSLPSPPLPLEPKSAGVLILNGGQPDTVIVEVTEDMSPNPANRVTTVTIPLPAGPDPVTTFIGEVDLELKLDNPNQWIVHIAYGPTSGTATTRRAFTTRTVAIAP